MEYRETLPNGVSYLTLDNVNKVGYENTSAFLGAAGLGKFACPYSKGPGKVAVCATATAADKLQGTWYSTLTQGHGVTWKVVEVVKRVRRDCHSNSFYDVVEKRSPACFNKCKPTPSAPRNTSSLCWAGCFLDTALGPQARSSMGDTSKGMPSKDILAAWSRPFESDDPAKGGCPNVPETRAAA